MRVRLRGGMAGGRAGGRVYHAGRPKRLGSSTPLCGTALPLRMRLCGTLSLAMRGAGTRVALGGVPTPSCETLR